MKSHQLYLPILVFLFCIAQIQAQSPCNLKLQGRILHSHDSSALVGAEVFIEQGHYFAVTDPQGNFVTKGLCKGKILLELDLDGQHHVHFRITLNKDTFIEIFLEPHVFHDSLIVVNEKSKQEQNMLSRSRLENAAGNDLSTMVSGINGIRVLQNGNTINKPMAQGMYGLRLPIVTDGVKMEGQQWGDDHAPEADALGFDAIEWVQDAKVLLLAADAPAGALVLRHNARYHPGQEDFRVGTGFMSNGRFFNAWGLMKKAGRDSGTGKYLQFSARRGGNTQTPEYYLGNTGLFETGLQGGLTRLKKGTAHQLNFSLFRNESGILEASHISSVADLEAAIKRGKPYNNPDFTYAINKPRQLAVHTLLNYTRQGRGNELTLAAQYNLRREFDFHISGSNNTPQLDLNLITLQVKQVFKYTSRSWGNTSYGYSSQAMVNRYFTYFLIPDYEALQSAVFLVQEKRWKRFTVIGSARYDVKYLHASWEKSSLQLTDQRWFHNYASVITLQQKWRKGLLAADLSRLWRNPWVNELYSAGVHHGNASYEKGNKDLKSEKGYKLQLRFNCVIGNLEMGITGYGQYFRDFIQLSPDTAPVLTIRGAFPSYEYRQFDALYAGASGFVRFKAGDHLQIVSEADYVYGRNLSRHAYPAFLPPLLWKNRLELSFNYVQWFAEWVYCARQNLYTQGTDYLPPPAAYSLLNAGLTKQFNKKNRGWELQCGVNNLLNIAYRNYLDRFRYYADLPGRNIYLKLKLNLHHHEKHH